MPERRITSITRKRKSVSIVFTGTAAALAAVAVNGTPAAAASQTWRVAPGGAFTMKTTGSAVLTDIANSAKLTCTPKSSGKILAGSGTGTLAKLAAGNQPWHLNGYLYTASQGTTSGFMKSFGLTVAGAGNNCKATLAGSGTFRYTNSTGTLALSGVLTVKSAASCPGGLAPGGNEEIRATFAVSPKQTITETS
jgi:hypothetical protein